MSGSFADRTFVAPQRASKEWPDPPPRVVQTPQNWPLHLQRAAGNLDLFRLLQGDGGPATMTTPGRSGEHLELTTRLLMESRFGQDFSSVRVYTDSAAARSAEAMAARAYTVGHDIVFGEGQYAPTTTEGKQTLAHELAHVVQQRRGGVAPEGRSNASHEQDAHQVAVAVASGASGVLVQAANSPGLAKEADPEIEEREEEQQRNKGPEPSIQPSAHRPQLPTTPHGLPFEAEVFPNWSTPLRNEPRYDAIRLIDLPRHHIVSVEGGKAWLRVKTVVGGKPLSGFISHEQLRPISSRPRPTPAPQPNASTNPDLPPLRGQITEASALFVRAEPGSEGAILGKLSLRGMEVIVFESREVRDSGIPIKDLWYHVRFNQRDFETVVSTYSGELVSEQLSGVPKASALIEAHTATLRAHRGTDGWVGRGAVPTIAMPWPFFLRLLAVFEAEHADEPILTRLSRLRQIGEESDVPANQVVGAGADVKNQMNLDQRTHDPKRWQLLYESKQVELPGGEIVDIHHMLLGVESLLEDGRRSESRTITFYKIPVINIGQSYAAATWSGDVGGAAADFVHHMSVTWEKGSAIGRSEDDVMRFYFRTRAPDLDLLGDIDAWGAYELVPTPKTAGFNLNMSLVAVLTSYYGTGSASNAEHQRAVSFGRARGLRNLLTHYGFTSTSSLASQETAVAALEKQVLIFSKAWFQAKSSFAGKTQAPPPWAEDQLIFASRRMTQLFVEWLQTQCRRYNVTLESNEGAPQQ